ncbi:MAG TPA: hypothetical protein VFQ13_11250 [Anaerolineales bacterium]|nr:hypothetical protein [Anaerolineales bacterium]
MNRLQFMIISSVLFVIGILVLFSSVTWGHEAANSYLRSQGGGMDTAQFMIILQEQIQTFRWLGIILSLIGGVGFVRAIEMR